MGSYQLVTRQQIDYSDSVAFFNKTDTKGIITYANDSFIEISGFSREELLSRNHNIIGHSDMTMWAFEEFWETVSNGQAWRGLVKSRAGNGDYYWIIATVAPIIENNTLVGYSLQQV